MKRSHTPTSVQAKRKRTPVTQHQSVSPLKDKLVLLKIADANTDFQSPASVEWMSFAAFLMLLFPRFEIPLPAPLVEPPPLVLTFSGRSSVPESSQGVEIETPVNEAGGQANTDKSIWLEEVAMSGQDILEMNLGNPAPNYSPVDNLKLRLSFAPSETERQKELKLGLALRHYIRHQIPEYADAEFTKANPYALVFVRGFSSDWRESVGGPSTGFNDLVVYLNMETGSPAFRSEMAIEAEKDFPGSTPDAGIALTLADGIHAMKDPDSPNRLIGLYEPGTHNGDLALQVTDKNNNAWQMRVIRDVDGDRELTATDREQKDYQGTGTNFHRASFESEPSNWETFFREEIYSGSSSGCATMFNERLLYLRSLVDTTSSNPPLIIVPTGALDIK